MNTMNALALLASLLLQPATPGPRPAAPGGLLSDKLPVTRELSRLERRGESLGDRVESLSEGERYRWALGVRERHPELADGLLYRGLTDSSAPPDARAADLQDRLPRMNPPERTMRVWWLERNVDRLGEKLETLSPSERARWALDTYQKHPWLADGLLEAAINDEQLPASLRAEVAMKHAEGLDREGLHGVAIARYDDALRLMTPDLRERYELPVHEEIADIYVETYRYREAIERYEQVLAKRESPRTRLKLANAQLKHGRDEAAARTLIEGFLKTKNEELRENYRGRIEGIRSNFDELKPFTFPCAHCFGTDTGNVPGMEPLGFSSLPDHDQPDFGGGSSAGTCTSVPPIGSGRLHDELAATIRAHDGFIDGTTSLKKGDSSYPNCRVRVEQTLEWFNGGSTDPEGAGDSPIWENMQVIAEVGVNQGVVEVTVTIAEDEYVVGKSPSRVLYWLANYFAYNTESVGYLTSHPVAMAFGNGLRERLTP